MSSRLNSPKLINVLSRLDTLTNWEARPRGGMRVGLEPMADLMVRLGNPHQAFRSIHVAGTKGKSSTCSLLEAGLAKAGIQTGRYLSPHIDHICERISINGHPVSEDQLADALESGLSVFQQATAEKTSGNDSTWFDILTASGFLLFQQAGVEWAVIETGLGGRLDSTNIAPSVVQVITNVELEHTEVLGSTRSQIAFEKAGIIKSACHVVTPLPAWDDAGQLIQSRADELGATVVRPETQGSTIRERNVSAARLALDAANSSDNRIGGWLLDRETIAGAALPGRMEMRTERVAETEVPIVFDGAHVPFNLAAVLNDLEEVIPKGPCTAVVALATDKDAENFLRVLHEKQVRVIFTTANSQSRSPTELADIANRMGLVCTANALPTRAYTDAIEGAAKQNGWVLVTGSLYLVSLVRNPAPRS